jgi:putative flippase GtrA
LKIANSQLTRFILVGVISNGVAFVAYLLLALVIKPVVAMTFLYGVGFIVSFIGNRSFTFNHTSALVPTVLRFTLMHLVLYALRYGMFDYFVTYLRLPHQLVQAFATVAMAILSYTASRRFVFHKPETITE